MKLYILQTLPNGKIIYQDNNLYQSNLLRLLTSVDYNNLNDIVTNLNDIVTDTKNKIDTLFVMGSKVIDTSFDGKTVNINVGFKPSIIFVYSSQNAQIDFGSNIYPNQCRIPVILADINLTSTQGYNSKITNNGFQTELRRGSSGWSSITNLFYIAFKDFT